MADVTERSAQPVSRILPRRRRALALTGYFGTGYLVGAGLAAAEVLVGPATAGDDVWDLLPNMGDWWTGMTLGTWGLTVLLAVLITTLPGVVPLLKHAREYRGPWQGLLLRSAAHGLSAIMVVIIVCALMVLIADEHGTAPVPALPFWWGGTWAASRAVLWFCRTRIGRG